MDPEDIVMFILRNKILLLLLLVFPAMHGAIHFIVSNFDFPLDIEKFLWKIASIDIMVTMPAFFMWIWTGHFISRCFDDN